MLVKKEKKEDAQKSIVEKELNWSVKKAC